MSDEDRTRYIETFRVVQHAKIQMEIETIS